MMMGLQARVQVLADEPQRSGRGHEPAEQDHLPELPEQSLHYFLLLRAGPGHGGLAFCNAGHNPPVIVRANGAVESLDGGGPPLGILSIANYAEYRAKLEPGDVLAIYSDGVTEANNAKEEEFGDERFAAVLAANRHKSAAEIVAAVNQALTDIRRGIAAGRRYHRFWR
jgi:phosphoserine phosphatase RsbU/P